MDDVIRSITSAPCNNNRLRTARDALQRVYASSKANTVNVVEIQTIVAKMSSQLENFGIMLVRRVLPLLQVRVKNVTMGMYASWSSIIRDIHDSHGCVQQLVKFGRGEIKLHGDFLVIVEFARSGQEVEAFSLYLLFLGAGLRLHGERGVVLVRELSVWRDVW